MFEPNEQICMAHKKLLILLRIRSYLSDKVTNPTTQFNPLSMDCKKIMNFTEDVREQNT